jgi:hypothetical protein
VFCTRNEVEFSVYKEVTIPVGVFAINASVKSKDPTGWLLLIGPLA